MLASLVSVLLRFFSDLITHHQMLNRSVDYGSKSTLLNSYLFLTASTWIKQQGSTSVSSMCEEMMSQIRDVHIPTKDQEPANFMSYLICCSTPLLSFSVSSWCKSFAKTNIWASVQPLHRRQWCEEVNGHRYWQNRLHFVLLYILGYIYYILYYIMFKF